MGWCGRPGDAPSLGRSGNAGIKYFLSAEPEVSVVDLDAIELLILCSDGLTDVMDSRAASETMRAVPMGAMSSSPSPKRKTESGEQTSFPRQSQAEQR